jgi:peptide/nickel transport system substrate-binding protein
MRKSCPIFTSLSCLVLLVLTISIVAFSTTKVIAEPRGEIRVVENWRPDTNILGHNVLQYLYEYALDKNELVPSLAISREWIDDRTLELKLRKGVRFHNGEPFDAYAVKFNFDYQRRHSRGRGAQVYLNSVKNFEIIDAYTVRIGLEIPNSLILDNLIFGPNSGFTVGAPRYMERVGWQEFQKRPVGTGPYMVEGETKDYQKLVEDDVFATLVANPNYWVKGYPKIQKITALYYSATEAQQAVIEGRVDLVTSLIPKDTLKVEESAHSKVVKGRDDMAFMFAGLNLISRHTIPLHDMRVRKALNYAVNKKELLRYAFKGNAVEMRGALTEKSGVDLSDAEPYEWNIPKARELLREAGYEEGFKMKVFYFQKDYLVARLLQRFYSLLNIEVELAPCQWNWIEEHIVKPNLREDHSWHDEDWWMYIESEPAVLPEIMSGRLLYNFNFAAPFRYASDSLLLPLDIMYEEILRTTDREKRFQIYKKANDYIADQALWVFTMAPLSLYGVNKELNFIPQVSQYLYLDYSSVTDRHWSLRGENNEYHQ